MNQRTECLSVLQSGLKPRSSWVYFVRHRGDVNCLELHLGEKIERQFQSY